MSALTEQLKRIISTCRNRGETTVRIRTSFLRELQDYIKELEARVDRHID